MNSSGLVNALSSLEADICASRFAAASQRMAHAKQQVEEAYVERRAALVTLREHGWTYQQIGDLVGITRQGAEHILRTRKGKGDS